MPPLLLPIGGVHQSSSASFQPPGTTPDALNVIPWDIAAKRQRIGKRPGLSRYFPNAINGVAPVRTLFSGINERPPWLLTPGAVIFSDSFNRADTTGTDPLSTDWTVKSATMPVSVTATLREVTNTNPASATDDPLISGNKVVSLGTTTWCCIYDVATIAQTAFVVEIKVRLNTIAAIVSATSSVVGLAANMNAVGAPAQGTYGLMEVEVFTGSGANSWLDYETMIATEGSSAAPPAYHGGGTSAHDSTGAIAPDQIVTLQLHVYAPTAASRQFVALYCPELDAVLDYWLNPTTLAASRYAGFFIQNVDSGAAIVSVDDFTIYAASLRPPSRRMFVVAESNGVISVSIDGGDPRPAPGSLNGVGNTGALAPSDRLMGFVGRSDPDGTFNIGQDRFFYFTDGVQCGRLDIDRRFYTNWAAPTSFGTQGVSVPRILVNWGNRAMFSGLAQNPQEIAASAIDDYFDYTYSGTTELDAYLLSDQVGLAPDIITALAPHSSAYCFVGLARSIHILSGDPRLGGRLDDLTSETGVSGRFAWCRDDRGNMYFHGERGLFVLTPTGAIEYLSQQRMDRFFADIDPMTEEVALEWDDIAQGIHITRLRTDATTPDCLFWSRITGRVDGPPGSFWPLRYSAIRHPSCIHFTRGFGTHAAMLLGGVDGVVRQWDASEFADGDEAIESYCDLVTILGQPNRAAMLTLVQASLSNASGGVDFEVSRGRDADEVLSAEARWSHSREGPGRLRPILTNMAGAALRLRIAQTSADETWALERVDLNLESGHFAGENT